MKIAVVPSWYSSDKAPSRGSFVKDQATALAKRGHDVTIIAFDRDASDPVLGVRRSVENGLPHVRIAVPSPWHRLLGFYAPSILSKRLASILKDEKPDIVHAHAVRPAGIVTSLAMRFVRTPWCLTEHSGPLHAFWWTAHGHRQIDRAYRSAPRLFGVSASLVTDMQRHFPEGAHAAKVLHNGIDTTQFRWSPSSPRPIAANLLFVGSLTEGKGVTDLLQAVRRLPPSIPWTLSMVGSGPMEKALRDQAATFGIQGRIQWLGPIPHDAMPAVYAAHDLLVVPSLAETFSLVSAEALACGVPVVATLCGGPEEVIGPLALPLVPPGDPPALCGAIREMLGKLSTFDRAGGSRSIEQRFSITALAAKLEAHYAEMVQEPK